MAIITGTSAAEVLNGTADADELYGLGGSDTLDGGAGADTMLGGGGNDRYLVDDAGDVVSEAGGTGVDSVYASVAFTLGAGVENLVLTGADPLTGAGNTLANTLTGNAGANRLNGLAGNDTLDGGAGNDSMVGGQGNDTYVVTEAGDKTTEFAGQGSDTVLSSVTRLLGNNLEKLTLTGSANINGLGNALDNMLTGNAGHNRLTDYAGNDVLIGDAGNDVLHGGAGADTLYGGDHNDVLVWDAADTLIDGDVGSDTLRVDAGALDLTAVSDGTIVEVEVIKLAGATTLTLTAADVLALSSATIYFTNVLTVNGGAGDAVIAGAGWSRIRDSTVNSQTYAQYVKAGATLRVDVDIDRSGIGQNLTISSPLGGLLDGSNGFRLSGAALGDFSGDSVSAAGDVNGDGFADLVIGAADADPHGNSSGVSYVVFGRASGFTSNLDLSALDGTNGFQLSGGAAYDRSGRSVSAAGDVNGDGFADLVIGAVGDGATESFDSASYVVFGHASGFASNLDLSALDGANGFQIAGEAGGNLSGRSVSTVGDVNGDGFADLVIGDDQADPNGLSFAGATYVVFGHASGFGANLDVSALDGANGFRLSGEAWADFSGGSVSSAGDVNGDGFDDILIGADWADPHGSRSGAAYVVFGQASGFGANLNLSALDGANGFQLSGEAMNDFSGYSVSTAGDVNGDGFDDLLIGAFGADPHESLSGASYVVFGHASGFASKLELSALDGVNGFQLSGEAAYDRSGHSVAAAGDVNGDGYDDLVIGAGGADPFDFGATYVVFGRASGFTSNLDLSALDETNGFRLDGTDANDRMGDSVSSAGDVNGDGFADLIIGAPNAYSYGVSRAGESYVVFGGDFNGSVTHQGTAGADALTGTGAAEVLVSGQGNDTLTGAGGADVFRGGEGNDLIRVSSAAFFDVDGGSGADTLALVGTSLGLDLTAFANSKVTGIEIINLLAGSGANALTLAVGDVLDLSDTTNTLTVIGGTGDTVTVADGAWTDGGVVGNYHVYTFGAATLKVDLDIASVTITITTLV